MRDEWGGAHVHIDGSTARSLASGLESGTACKPASAAASRAWAELRGGIGVSFVFEVARHLRRYESPQTFLGLVDPPVDVALATSTCARI